MQSPPPSWQGKQESDGYEYLEFPIGSDEYWFRQIGGLEWQKWGDNPDYYQQSSNQFENQMQNYQQHVPPREMPQQSDNNYIPSQQFSQAISPPPPISVQTNSQYQYPVFSSNGNFGRGTMKTRKKGRGFLKVFFILITIFGLLSISAMGLYYWAENLESSSSSYDPYYDCEIGDSSDYDCDGIYDGSDNCVYESNYDQDDYDGDGQGDVCDSDIDDDGYLNGNDFYDYGDGELTFSWNYIRIDDYEEYDGDGSGPDAYAQLGVDFDKDGDVDSTYYSDTINNIREASYIDTVVINPNDDRTSIKITLRFYDDDYSSDDILDYNPDSSYTSFVFTVSLSESTYLTYDYDGRNGDKGINVRFTFYT